MSDASATPAARRHSDAPLLTPSSSASRRRASDVLVEETLEDGRTRTLLRLGGAHAHTLDEHVLGACAQRCLVDLYSVLFAPSALCVAETKTRL